MDNAALEAIEKLIIALGYKVRNVALGSASVPAKDGTVSSKQIGIFTVVDGTAKVDDDTATTALTSGVTGYDMIELSRGTTMVFDATKSTTVAEDSITVKYAVTAAV
jgi:hypothetical protein